MDLSIFKDRVRAIRDTSASLREKPLSHSYEQCAKLSGFTGWNALSKSVPALSDGQADEVLGKLRASAGMNEPAEESFRTIEFLPKFEKVAASDVRSLNEQRTLLERAQATPHLLDDDTLDQVSAGVRRLQSRFDHQASQILRWREQKIDAGLGERLGLLSKTNQAARSLALELLARVASLREGTIDRIMEMSDFELGVAAMTGGFSANPAMAAAKALEARELATRRKGESTNRDRARQLEEAMKKLPQGISDQAVFNEMAIHLHAIDQIYKSADDHELMDLCRRFPEFERFARIAEDAFERERSRPTVPANLEPLPKRFAEQLASLMSRLSSLDAELSRTPAQGKARVRQALDVWRGDVTVFVASLKTAGIGETSIRICSGALEAARQQVLRQNE